MVDVDGVVTNGTMMLDESGRESKTISFADIMGVSIGRRAGLSFAFVSGEGGPLLDVIAARFGIDEVYAGCKDKAGAVRDFAARHDIALAEICFIGDDANDISAMEICGFAVAPATAQSIAAASAAMVAINAGGAGVVREVIEYLLNNWESSRDVGDDAERVVSGRPIN
jgi:3-deoxy-D-manno-octulosonate 8-phosphate phosphatase (KDO 8-P phosphatase)